MAWLLVLAACPLLAYGVLNIVKPSVTMRWQAAATLRRTDGDPRGQIGRAFQSAVGDSEQRVRLIGVIEVAVAIALIAVALAGA